jgi:tetratricopeptide (TPR) repeat protein
MLRTILVAVVLLAASVPASAARPKNAAALAEKRVELGLRWFRLGEMDKAIAEWEQAYVLMPDVDTLWKLAQAYRRKGDCAAAVRRYRELLEYRLSPAQRAKVEEGEAQCLANLSAMPGAAEAPAAPRSWYRDPLGGLLVGAGAAGLLLGTTFYILAENVESLADREPSYGVFVDDLESANRRRRLSLGCFIAGGALMAGGVLRYTLVGGESPVQASAAVTGDGATLVISGVLP